MKSVRFVLFTICISFLLSCCNVYALEYTHVDIMQRQGKETIISTGNGYLKWAIEGKNDFETYYSKDKINWQLITNNENRTVLHYPYDTNTNIVDFTAFETDEYIVMVSSSYQFPLGMSRNRAGCAILLDNTSFDVIKDCRLDGPIGVSSYIDGVFYALIYTDFYSNNEKDIPYETYITATAQKTVYTTDFENWYDYSNDGSIPITNGKTILLTRNSLITAKEGTNLYGEREVEPQKVYIRSDGNDSEIIYESIDVAQIFPFRDLYIGIPSTAAEELCGKFLVSHDGVYFNIVDLPGETQCLYTMSEIQDDMILMSINTYKVHFQGLVYQLCSYDELKEYAMEASVYVKYNGNILGFETPPIIENDRTLIPVRFLFEQMGATVDWNQETQTATILRDNTAISLDIDNTEAQINGEPVTMDVPSRLINGKTMVPIRFLSEELGYTVDWDEESRIITIK